MVINIAHNPGTASHISNLGIIITRLIILEIKRCIQEAEIREQSLRRGSYCHLEKVIVRVTWIIIYTLLDLKNLYGENWSFAISEAIHGSIKKIPYYHTCLYRCISSIIYRAEWNLSSSTGIHGLHVVLQLSLLFTEVYTVQRPPLPGRWPYQ